MKKRIALLIAMSSVYAEANSTYIPNIETTDTFKKYSKTNNINTFTRTKNTFIELTLGTTNISTKDHTFSTSAISKSAFNQSAIHSLSAGHYINQHLFTRLSYQTSSFDIADIDNTSFSFDYQFDVKFRPYIGGIIGYSNLTWDKSIMNNTYQKIKKSQSFLLGMEIGATYQIDQDFAFTTKIQALKYNHITTINNQTFEHNLQTNVFVGVKYDIY